MFCIANVARKRWLKHRVHVCSSGSVVVLDPEDCPDDSSNPTPNDNGNVDDDTFYFVCPGGSDVVTDLSECEGSIVGGTSNLTLVVDPSSNASSDYITCDGGKAIVLDMQQIVRKTLKQKTLLIQGRFGCRWWNDALFRCRNLCYVNSCVARRFIA